MKSRIIKLETALLLICSMIASSGCRTGKPASSNDAQPTVATANANNNVSPATALKFTDDELDELLARIALYPDPILAQMIPASTFVDQLKEANETLNGKSDDNLIADKNWDVSVKSVAHYPKVLKLMVDDVDWTTTLGQAYVEQPDDVAKSIQRLRSEARAAGNLQTTTQQDVSLQNEVIKVEPAQPKTIYVPEYDPQTVYVEEKSGVSTGTAIAMSAVSFGAGLLIGSWLNNDYDYYGRGIYYHGWAGGPAWVGVNRRYVDVNRNMYVNNRFTNVNVNRNIVNNNRTAYRASLTRNATLRSAQVSDARNRRGDLQPGGRAGIQPGNDRAKVNKIDRKLTNPGGPARAPKIGASKSGEKRKTPNPSRNPSATPRPATRTSTNVAPKSRTGSGPKRTGGGARRHRGGRH